MDPVSAALPQNLRRIFVATLPFLAVQRPDKRWDPGQEPENNPH